MRRLYCILYFLLAVDRETWDFYISFLFLWSFYLVGGWVSLTPFGTGLSALKLKTY